MFKFLLCLVLVSPIYGAETSSAPGIKDTLGKTIASEIDDLEADTTSLNCPEVKSEQCATSEEYVRKLALYCSYKRLAITKTKEGESCLIKAYNSEWAKKRYQGSIVIDKELKPYPRVAINHFATLGKEFRRIVQKKEKGSYPFARKIKAVLLSDNDIFSPSIAAVELKKKKESEPRSKHAESASTLLKTYGAILTSATLDELLKVYKDLGIKTTKEGFEPSVCKSEKDFREFASTTSFGSKENFLKCWEASKDWLSLRAEKQEMWKDADKQKKNMLIIVLLSEVSRMKHVRPEIVALAINLVKQYGGGESQEESLLMQAHDANLLISKLEDRMTFPKSLDADGEEESRGRSQELRVVVGKEDDRSASESSATVDPGVATGSIILEQQKVVKAKTLPAMDMKKLTVFLKRLNETYAEFIYMPIEYTGNEFKPYKGKGEQDSFSAEEQKSLLQYHARGRLGIIDKEIDKTVVEKAKQATIDEGENKDKINRSATYLLTLLSTEDD